MRQRKRKGDADLPARKRNAGIQGLLATAAPTREHVARLAREFEFSERLALSALADLTDADGAGKVSIAQIADRAALNCGLVRRAIRMAADAGVLSVQPRERLELRSAKLTMVMRFVSPEARDAVWIKEVHCHHGPARAQ